jgi:hypothetical protein
MAFPSLQTQRATFTALRFPVLDATCSAFAFEAMDLGFPSELHQFKHSTTCCVTTPTVLENKIPLLKPSSAFLTPSILPLVKRLSLTDIRRVHPITGWHLAITLLRPLSRVLASSHPVAGSSGVRVPPVEVEMFQHSVAAYRTPDGPWKSSPLRRQTGGQPSSHFG